MFNNVIAILPSSYDIERNSEIDDQTNMFQICPYMGGPMKTLVRCYILYNRAKMFISLCNVPIKKEYCCRL